MRGRYGTATLGVVSTTVLPSGEILKTAGAPMLRALSVRISSLEKDSSIEESSLLEDEEGMLNNELSPVTNPRSPGVEEGVMLRCTGKDDDEEERGNSLELSSNFSSS